MFQLIYLTFTAPRADPGAFRVLTEQLKVALAHQDALPDVAFQEALDAALSQNHPRAQPMTAARVDQMDLDKSLAFYKDRFADASAFTFVFVGSFDLATMTPLVERYLGSLPALHRHETARDTGMHPPAGVVEKQVRRGIEPRSQVSIVYTGPFQNDEMHRVVLRAMAETLSGNLHRTLREELGGTYGVSVEPRFMNRPAGEYRVTISFGCDPTRAESLLRTAFQLIEEFRNTGPSDGQVADERAALVRDFETNSQRNDYLLERILFKYEYHEDVEDIFNMRQFYDQLTAPMLRDAARTYLNPNRYVEVMLLPDTR
jgi:zinc protease